MYIDIITWLYSDGLKLNYEDGENSILVTPSVWIDITRENWNKNIGLMSASRWQKRTHCLSLRWFLIISISLFISPFLRSSLNSSFISSSWRIFSFWEMIENVSLAWRNICDNVFMSYYNSQTMATWLNSKKLHPINRQWAPRLFSSCFCRSQ